MKNILPSILNARNLEKFLTEIQNCNEKKISYIEEIHVDLMDGIFVESKRGNIDDILVVKKYGMKANVHFMYEDPSFGIGKALQYGANSIIIHYEIPNFNDYLKKLLEAKAKNNIQIGISICPETKIEEVEKILPNIDMVLLMSVNPGKGGQTFIQGTYSKLNKLRKMNESICIIVDGGINNTNINDIFNAGADKVVIGNYLTQDYSLIQERLQELKRN